MEEITIRPLERDDTALILDFFNEVSREQTYILFQGEQLTINDEILYIDDFLRKTKEGRAVKLLAFHNAELIGVADVYLKEKVEKHVGIFGIMVRKEWRNKGIGKRLMAQTLEEAVRKMPTLQIITLGVFGNNPVAKKMYEKMGFTQYGMLPKGIIHKGQPVDHFYMYKKVR